MRTKVTLVLLFLNVALFFFIFWLKPWVPPPAEKGPILGPEINSLQSIEISGPTRGTPVRLERRGESWVMTQPVEWPANENAVNRIFTELQQLRPQAFWAVKTLPKNNLSLADYGLDNPPLTLTLYPSNSGSAGAAPKPLVLRVGNPAKSGNTIYLLSTDGEQVYVVRRSFAESLLVKAEDLRSPYIFTIQTFEARSLNVQTGPPYNSKVRIARVNSRWVLENPVNTRANKAETDVTINQLNGLRLQNFVDPRSTEALRLTPEEMTLRIALEGNNRSETLILGGKAPAPAKPADGSDEPNTPAGDTYYARMEEKAKTEGKSPVFTVTFPTDLLKKLTSAQDVLRDRHILDVDPANITTLTISAPNQPDLTLQRLDATAANSVTSTWQIVRRTGSPGATNIPADRAVVDNLLRQLADLSAKEFTSDGPGEAELENFGFNRPIRKVAIAVANPGTPAPGAVLPSTTLLIGSGGMSAGRNVYAKLESPNYVYQVSEDIVAQLPVEPLAYRQRLLRELPAGAKVTALKLVDLSNDTALLDVTLPLPAEATVAASAVQSGAGGPNVANANAIPRATIEALAAQLRTLRAKRFVRDEFTKTVTLAGEERPWRYRLTVTLALVGGDGAQTVKQELFFSERIGGNVQVVGSPDPDLNVVFEAEQPLLDAVFAITYGPRDPGPPAPEAGEKPTSPEPAPSAAK